MIEYEVMGAHVGKNGIVDIAKPPVTLLDKRLWAKVYDETKELLDTLSEDDQWTLLLTKYRASGGKADNFFLEEVVLKRMTDYFKREILPVRTFIYRKGIKRDAIDTKKVAFAFDQHTFYVSYLVDVEALPEEMFKWPRFAIKVRSRMFSATTSLTLDTNRINRLIIEMKLPDLLWYTGKPIYNDEVTGLLQRAFSNTKLMY